MQEIGRGVRALWIDDRETRLTWRIICWIDGCPRPVDGREERREQVASALLSVPGRNEHSSITEGIR
jgi:hypothetical protein